MPDFRQLGWVFSGLGLMIFGISIGNSWAEEPRVAFALKKGWVDFTLLREGKPVQDALVRILDAAGNNFAEGQTGPDGQGGFPMPRGPGLTLEIKTGNKTADPIRLLRNGDSLQPAKVLLSYGLRPCCRFLPGKEPKGPTPETEVLKVVPPAPRLPDLAQEAREDLARRNFRPLSAPLEALIADSKYEPVPTQTHPLLLHPVPDFTLLDVQGKEWSLARELREGPVVLVFYFGYQCNHCVSQLFGLDKDFEKFRELGVKMVAISADPPELTQARFRQYGAFAFPVLSDLGNKVAEKFETYIPNPKAGEKGDLLHGTFLIKRDGSLVWVNRGDEPFTENRSLLHAIAGVEGRLPSGHPK